MMQDKAPAKPVNPLFEKREKRFGEPMQLCRVAFCDPWVWAKGQSLGVRIYSTL